MDISYILSLSRKTLLILLLLFFTTLIAQLYYLPSFMSKRNVIPVQSTRCQPSKKTILKYLHEHVLHKFVNEITKSWRDDRCRRIIETVKQQLWWGLCLSCPFLKGKFVSFLLLFFSTSHIAQHCHLHFSMCLLDNKTYTSTRFQPATWDKSIWHHRGFLHRRTEGLRSRGCGCSKSNVNPCALLHFLDDDRKWKQLPVA